MEIEQNMPNHVSIIPDGNRRWAKNRNLEPWDGHEEGAKMIEEIITKSRELGIKNLSFWGSSVENIEKRPFMEKRALMKIYEKYFTKLIDKKEIYEQSVQINIFGNWREQLPTKLVKILESGIEKTKKHDKYFLNFFLAYSGDEEMLGAIREISAKYEDAKQITKEVVKNHLLTKDLPPVDLLIRTGGEPHLSAGFMMWDIANSQLFFSEKNFPDFDKNQFENAITEYVNRKRRLGA